jgi:hypothetical protein
VTQLAHRLQHNPRLRGCGRFRSTRDSQPKRLAGNPPIAPCIEITEDIMPNQNRGTSNRGFASMDPEKQRQIASKGGKASHARGTAHEFTSEEASRAGRKAHAQGNAHEWTSEEAREAGRKGGQASGSNRANQASRARASQASQTDRTQTNQQQVR